MTSWAGVWTRAVVLPAARRAAAAWLGCAFVAALIFGPTGMHPADLTGLAWRHPATGLVLVGTWLLIFLPTARLLVRGEAASYLRALPAPRALPHAITTLAVLGLQLPWVALWVVGEGLPGVLVVGIVTLVLVALAQLRARTRPAGWPSWRNGDHALRAVYARALRRRAGDALIRGAGLALLAGAVGGLFVRNNALAGAAAATLGASVIAIVAIPAHVGAVLVLAAAHRETAWLAASLGLSATRRGAALVAALALVQLGVAVLAVVAMALLLRPTCATFAWLALAVLAIGLGTAFGMARVVLDAAHAPTLAGRVVVGAVVIAAGAVLALGVLGVAGAGAFGASTVLAFATRRDEERA